MAGVWVLTAMGDAHAHARKHAQTDGRAHALHQQSSKRDWVLNPSFVDGRIDRLEKRRMSERYLGVGLCL